jgi:hypothetical protein
LTAVRSHSWGPHAGPILAGAPVVVACVAVIKAGVAVTVACVTETIANVCVVVAGVPGVAGIAATPSALLCVAGIVSGTRERASRECRRGVQRQAWNVAAIAAALPHKCSGMRRSVKSLVVNVAQNAARRRADACEGRREWRAMSGGQSGVSSQL